MKKILIIIFLGLLVYSPIFFNGFVWDDEVMFQKIGQSDVYFRPAISLIYSVIHNIFGQNPFFFHSSQIVFHILTAVLIYYLFKHFFSELAALFLSLIFLVHPTNVEAVSFASAMQEVTFTMVGIAGFMLLSSPRIRVDSGNDNIKIFITTIILLIALLMKETAVIFFPLTFFYLILFKREDKNILINYSVLSVIFLMVYFLFRITGGNFYFQDQGLFPIMRVDLATRLINIPMIVWYYLSKFIYPINLAIAQHWVVRTINFQSFWLPLMIEITLFIASIIHIIKTKNKAFLFFFIWFLLGLLPHLQIIPLNMTVAERWLYFPMVGLLGMMGAILSNFKFSILNFQINLKSKTIFILLMIIVSVFSLRSFTRVLDWRNGLSLFGRDIRKDSSFDLQNNMGVELFRVGKYDEAKAYFEKSVQLAPYWWVNWNNLGAIYEREKNIEKAATYYQKSISNGQYYLAYENLAKILVLYEKDQKKTEEFLKTALHIFPESKNLIEISVYFKEK